MMNRIKYLDKGIAMIVSDIHGNKRDFEQVITIYQLLKQYKLVDYLILSGDLIHGYPGYHDDSLELLNAVMAMQDLDPNIIYLMGNHELIHVMHLEVQKGYVEFTQRFEDRIKHNRLKYIKYLEKLPFAVMTGNGLFVNHTGFSGALGGVKSPDYDLFLSVYPAWQWYGEMSFTKDFNLDDEIQREFQHGFGAQILDIPQGKLIWEVFMNKNEHSYPEDYEAITERFLQGMCNYKPVHLLISSHIEETDGYRVVSDSHFRICTSHGVTDDKQKKFLLVSLEDNYPDANSLKAQMRYLWADRSH
jgi:predicted phosphodiesterase